MKINKSKEINNSKVTSIIAIISLVLSIVLLVGFLSGGFNKPAETTEEIGLFDWGIGNVDEGGKIVESKKAIYTQDLHQVNGLEIKLEDDANITYRVVFYDEDKVFVSDTETSDADFDVESVPENAKYYRVVVMPYQVDGEDVIINIFNVNKYAQQLEIVHNV